MRVTPDEQASKLASKAKQSGEPHMGPEESPLSYSPQPELTESGSIIPASTFKTKPTNFFSLSKDHDNIHGQFIIDPSISIPSFILLPLYEGETEDYRRNLYLRSQLGSVEADIWLLGPSATSSQHASKRRRTTIALASDHGSVNAQVHTLDGAAPFSLTARASHGSVQLTIPRSFQGLLFVSTQHGNISLSDALVPNMTQLSQFGNTQRYFVGDFHLGDFHLLGKDTWEGNQIEMDVTHGTVRVKYADEVPSVQCKKSWFEWFFQKVVHYIVLLSEIL